MGGETTNPQGAADTRARVREVAARMLEGQLSRWGLTCALEPWADIRAEVGALRQAVYRDKLPHMLADGGRAPVDADDERAFHFVARREGVAVAALRLLPPPFEADLIFPDLAAAVRPGVRYIELGRLVGSPGAGEVGASRVLALHALVWGLDRPEYDGLLAYARERASQHFRLFGMQVATRVEHAEGKAAQPYVLLVSHLDDTMGALSVWG